MTKDRVAERFLGQLERALAGTYIDAEEAAILTSIVEAIPAFEGESFVPCHRDYCAANWLVDGRGTLTGIIDFEFSQWDIRMADFSRDPDWNWIRRPDLSEAFLEGYGRPLSPQEQEQLLVARAEYALGAILWGRDVGYHGFEREGRDALRHLASSLDCGLAATRRDVV
jgi:Ser/Thr protein kinase RdoA (MazF antagonist)